MKKHFFLLFLSFIIFMGCAVTHPRISSDLNARALNIKNILVLDPDVKIDIKYYDTDSYIHFIPKTQQAKEQFVQGFQKKFETIGYSSEKEIFPQEKTANTPSQAEPIPSVSYKETRDKVTQEIKEKVDFLILNDLEHRKKIIKSEKLQKLQTNLPEEWKKYDAVIFCYGAARLETGREFKKRWVKNVTYNILLMPIAFISYFIPITIPLTLSTSSFIFQVSPDQAKLYFVILDTKDKAILYQNDYFMNSFGFSDDEFFHIAFDIFEEFPSQKDLQKKHNR